MTEKSLYKKWLKAKKDKTGMIAYPLPKRKRKKSKGRGWHYHPNAHSLASKGIPTKIEGMMEEMNSPKIPPKELYDIDYNLLSGFWGELLNVLLEDKKWSKRLYKLEVDESIEHSYEMEKAIQLFWWCSINDEWQWLDWNKITDSIIDFLEGRLEFYTELEKLEGLNVKRQHIEALRHAKSYKEYMSSEDKINWFDKLIHMEHERGSILFEINLNIDTLREDFESEYI